MFKCKACAVNSKMVDSLQSEISFLRTLVHPKVNNNPIPDSNHEANGVLDAIDRPIEIQTYAAATFELTEAELAERDAILGASY